MVIKAFGNISAIFQHKDSSLWKKLCIIVLVIACFFSPKIIVAQNQYSYTFTSKQWNALGAKNLNGVTWTATGTADDGYYFGYDNTKGQQFGSGSKPFSELIISTTGIVGTITSVTVNTSGANSISASFSVSVGGTPFQSGTNTSVSLTNTATPYTFTGSASGEIQLNWIQTSSKALYIKSIEIIYSETPSSPCSTWTLVTDANDLRIGDEIIIASAEEDSALSKQQVENSSVAYRKSTPVTKNGIYLSAPSNNIEIITLTAGTVLGSFALQTSNAEYLYAASNEENHLKTYSSLDDNGSWIISIGSDSVATIIAQGLNGNNILQYNKSVNPKRFTAYRSTESPISIYKLQSIHSDTSIVTCNPIMWYGLACAESGFYQRVAGVAANGCDSLQYLHLTINPTAEVTNTGDTVIAIGDVITLRADGASSYQWSTGEDTQEITISPNQTTTYYVTGTITDCQSSMASITVNVVTPDCSPWRRVTDVSNLHPGDRIVIAAPENTALGMRVFPYSNTRPSAPIHKVNNGDYITPPSSYIEQFVLENGNQPGEFAFRTSQGYYLFAPSADHNHLNITDTVSDNASWTLSPGSDGKIQIQLTHSSSPSTQRNQLRFNKNIKYFSSYSGSESNILSDCYIYKYYPFIMGDTTAYLCGTEFIWHDMHCTSPGDYTRIYTGDSDAGCDSMVTLHLLAHTPDTIILSADICLGEIYQENGFDTLFTIPGTYTLKDTSVSQYGCDSITELTLTVSSPKETTVNFSICENQLPYHYVNGQIDTTFEVGTPPLSTLNFQLSTVEGCDSVVTLHLTVNHDTTVVITKDTCDWYQWHNTIYRQSGRYEWHGETAQGCDSTEVLWLTIRKSTYGILNAEVCEDDLPLVLYGQTFTESVMSNAVISNAAGCDSLILINVTVKYNTYSDLYDTIVENSLPYDTLGMHFTETGTQTDTISNVAGCDSIVTFHLQVWPNAPITELDTVVCEGALPLVWHDSLFTVAGQKTVTLHTQHGADSVVTMHLTVNPMYDIQEPAIVMQSQLPYVWHGREFSADTTVCDTLRTVAGCDSVVCLDLTVTAYHVEDTAIALCPGETYTWHGQTLSEARSYRDTVPEENTIYIATVTINPTYSVTNPVIVPQGQLPYVWHGRAFSADTTVCDTLRTEAGCDSVVCLDLTVTAYHVEDTTITLCPGETYLWHGQILSEARSYRDTVPEENTIYIATVTINPTYSVTNPVIVPQGQLPYVWHGREFSADTTVCDTLHTQAGCDSVVCLDLTVTAYHVEDTIIALCPGETYTWHGQTLSEARNYRDTVPGENTIYIASVTINPTYSVTNPVVVPQGQLPYVWHGREFSADTTVCDTLRTEAGCDSVVCLDLTVTAYNVEDTAIALCPGETYLWHGQTLSEARSYRDTVPEENTIYIATVTINPIYSVTDPVIVPQGDLPYVWHGREFSADTTVCDTLRTVAGCDSVVCLDLTVTAYHVEDTAIALCPGETYPWHGQTLSEARSYRDTVPEENTIYIATVTINPTYSVTDPVIVPQGDLPYLWHGREFSADTTVCDTLRTVAGCDSVVCLDLTVTAYHVEDTAIALCPGETYPWHGQILSEARSYRDTIPGENTIFIATVTINPTYSVTDPVIVPQGQLPYVWHGRAFSADTTVCDTLRTAAGCDSVVCLDLTVTAYHVEDTAIALCPGETYPWHGQTLSEARSYRDTVPEENTIYIATVTISPTYSVTDPVIIPQGQLPYLWHGRAFSADTTVCDTLHTQAGCDSVVCLDLTVTSYNVEYTAITLCQGETYIWHNQILSEARNYRDTVPGENTIYIATVTINPTYSVTDPVVVPQGDLPYVWHGRAFSADTTVCDTLRTQAGCDSVVCLDLTVTAYHVEDTIIALCPSETYPWHGQILSEARSYRDTVPEENTIYIATVTINPIYSVTDPVIIPQGQLPYLWHGRAFSADTTVCDTLRTQAGCDSVVCLDLAVTAYNVEDTTIALCPGETYPWHGQILSEARSYRDTVPEENTIYIATVTINPTYSVTSPVIVPQGDLPYVWHGREFSADTTVCDTLRTVAGCDSVVCLDLTVTAYHVEDTAIALCPGETYPWHGQTLSEARSYRDTVPEENTIYIASVTINPTYSVTNPVIVPQSQLPYMWHGRAFSADTTVCDTLHTQAGCDSVVCLDLAVTAYHVEDTIIALCQGETYPWHGQTLSEARSYRDTVPEENTIYIASVTINPTYSVTNPVVVPQGDLPYVWHGREFSADTTVCDTLRTVAGCDSVVCLDLTVTAYHVEDTTIALCPGETYPWHGQTLSEARSYRDTVPEENTIYIATVTINPIYSVTDPVIVPQGQLPYLWHGREFSADTTVCDTLRTVAGCDSVVCLDLTVTAYHVEDTAIALCPGETYPWHGQILSEARSYRDTVPEENTIYIATVTVNPTYAVETFLAICENQLPYHYVNGQIDTTFDVGTPPLSSQNFQLSTITGCDSIVTLHLTVSSPTVSDIIVSSCGSFVWHGRTFTESTDTATFRTTNAAGCDIILTLHLTVNPLDSTDLYESICAGDTYDFNGRLISQEGIYRDTIHRQEACDSIVILHLSILNPSHQSYTIERCGSYTWENGDGQTYTESGQYYYRHENSDGCMQVDTLFLTIHPLPATPILSITPNTGCTEYNGIITVTAPVGGYLYDFDGGGFQSSNTFANLNAGEYIVSVRDVSHGCVSTTTALVTTVGNTLAVEVSGTSPCEGEDMQLFAETQSGGVTYLWSGPDNFTSTLQNPIVGNASPANAGVYTVLVTEMATGCVASGSLTVAVNPLPVVTVSGDAMIMIGHSATLTAMGADSYLWSNGAATPVVTVSPQEMTTYTVTGTNTFGCNDTASFEVVVIYDCFLPAQNGEEYVHCVSQVVPPQLPEVIACGDTIPLVAGENMGNVESGCGDSIFVYHYTFRDTQYTWTYTYHVSPDAMPLLNNRSIIISCLSDTVKPTPPVMVNSCLDTIVPIEMPVEVEVTGCSGVVRYVWKYEDCAGYQQNWTFSYIIRDNIAPTFSQPGDVAICRNANGTYDADTTITGLPVSLNDNCADTDDLSVSYNDLFVDNQNMADTLSRTWVVTDPCGNVARAVQKIIVYDTYHTEIHEGICGRDLPYTFNVGGRDTIISAVSSYSSTFNFPLISQNGCDSLVTLYLTVDTVAEIQEQLSICENELPYHFTYGQIDTIFDEGTPAFATYRFLIPAQGGCESIVWLALTVTPSYNVDICETACDMYIWHNTPYRQSGSYEWHGQTVNGCDSVETLRLTIHRSSMSVQDSTVCDNDLPFVWNGVTFYEAGNGSAVLAGANAEHCDSVVLMMLHVNRTDTTVLYDTIVENQLPYYYTNGQIDTTFAAGTAQSSTFRFLLQNVSGCDSTVTLYLTMNMNVTAQADSTVCENDLPLQWNGITFTGAGTDSVVLAASNGADSLLVMHVYVNPNTSAALYDTIVENQLPYHYTNGQIDTVFAVGTPHFTTSRFMLSNASGCDSAVTLKLTVILNVSVELDSAVCPSALPLIWNGVEFSDAGTDTAVVPASTGSDSVIVMHLTLLPVQLTNLHVEVCASDFPYHFVNGQIDTVIASLATHHAVFNFLFSTQDGCDSIVRLNLSVLDTSLSVVSLSDYCDNMSTTLSALSSMENFVWSTGEISQDIEVTAPGVYSVTASTGDCQSMSSYVVDACELVLYLPNAISPGKLDGHNDCFSLPERYIGLIDEFEITIVNRWGEVVFHSNDKNFKWYGDYKGSVVRQNVYNYIIHYTELDPKKGRHHLKGALIVL